MSIIVALLGPALIVWLRSSGFFGANGYKPRLYSAVLLWLITFIAISVAIIGDGQTALSLGLSTFEGLSFGWGILFGFLGLSFFPIYIMIARKFGNPRDSMEAINAIASAPLAIRLLFLATAAVVEELLFRAIPIIELVDLGVPLILAVFIPLAVFIILHRSSWGLLHLLLVTAGGLVLSFAFIIGGLWAAVIAHFIIDAPLMLMAPSMAKRNLSAINNSNQESLS